MLESSGINKDDMYCGNTHFKCRYDHRICHSRVKMSSTNWAVPNVRVFIANFIEHCHANEETMGSNPAEIFFIGLICNYIFVEKKLGGCLSK